MASFEESFLYPPISCIIIFLYYSSSSKESIIRCIGAGGATTPGSGSMLYRLYPVVVLLATTNRPNTLIGTADEDGCCDGADG